MNKNQNSNLFFNVKHSIIKRYLFMSLFTGILMGIIFPFFASLFTNYKSASYKIPFTICCIMAGCIVGVISFLIGKMTLIKAIRNFFKTFSSISEGDLTVRCHMQSQDELGMLSQEFNQFLEKMQEIFKHNQALAATVDELAKTLEESALYSEQISKEIVDGTATLAQGAILQSEQLGILKMSLEMEENPLRRGFPVPML